MLADFGETLAGGAAWWYRHLHWEAGILGHVLYLEGRGRGRARDGMGCYFDDVVHELLDPRLTAGSRDLYHFTVGGRSRTGDWRRTRRYAHLRRGGGS
jgi:hypothetical protein